jgi:hypothetical protein
MQLNRMVLSKTGCVTTIKDGLQSSTYAVESDGSIEDGTYVTIEDGTNVTKENGVLVSHSYDIHQVL